MSVPTATRSNATRAADRLIGWLERTSVPILRISLGLVFLAFALPKYVPGLSPAEPLVTATIEQLTFGVIAGSAALLLTAIVETVIGLSLLTGVFLRVGLLILGGALIGIMAPLVLFPDAMFAGGPTLGAQYVFKDIVLAAAGLVVATHTLTRRNGPRQPGPNDARGADVISRAA